MTVNVDTFEASCTKFSLKNYETDNHCYLTLKCRSLDSRVSSDKK